MSCLDLKGSEKTDGRVFRDDDPDMEVSFWCFAGHTTEKSKKLVDQMDELSSW